MDNRKLELVTDFYEFTMSNGYFAKNMQNTTAYFGKYLIVSNNIINLPYEKLYETEKAVINEDFTLYYIP